MNTKRLIANLPAALGLALFASSYAHAQLEEVIVTAERREEKLQETDISMTVMTTETLQERSITDFTQIGDFAPNVRTLPIPTSAGGSISIRGFRNGETIAIYEPKVGLYLDGVLIAKNAGAAFDVLDLERVEILRGPQGTLYGRNTAGGAVNFITKKPKDEFYGRVLGTLGDYGQQDVTGILNVPLTDTLAIKGTAASLNRDGYQDNKYKGTNDVGQKANGDVWDKNRDVYQVQLQWRPTDDLNFLYAYDKSNISEVNPAAQITAYNPDTHPELGPYVNNGSGNRNIDWRQFLNLNVQGNALTMNWQALPSMSIVSITSYRQSNDDSAQDSDGSPVWVFSTTAGNHVDTFTQELRAVGTILDERLDYAVGAFYMHEDIKDIYSHNILPRFGYLESNIDGSAKNENWAIFGESTYSVTQKFDVTLGVRYTHETKKADRTDSTIAPGIGLDDVTVLPQAGPKDFDDWSGTGSLTYRWADDIMTYAKVSKGYVSGGFNVRSPSPSTWQEGFDEETVWTYEIGWKTGWFGQHLLVNGAIFYNDYTDLQVNLLDKETTRNNLVNASDATIQGAELEFQAIPFENAEVGGGYGYLDAQYKNYKDPNTGQDLSNVTYWAHTPTNQYNLYARYEIPQLMSFGDFVARVDYAWVDDYSLLSSKGNKVSGYDIVNGRLELKNIHGPGDTTLGVALWGKNLTDQNYYTTGYDLVPSLGFAVKFTGPPRSYGVDLTLDF